MVTEMHRHPEETAAQIAHRLGVTPSAVRHARQRYGRYPRRVCSMCGERPVWDESRQAKRLSLCKGCFLAEAARREREDAEAARLRQRKSRRKK